MVGLYRVMWGKFVSDIGVELRKRKGVKVKFVVKRELQKLSCIPVFCFQVGKGSIITPGVNESRK